MPKVRIIEEYCKGCGLCVEACRQEVLQLSNRVNKRGMCVACVVNDGCTGCQNCVVMCPDAAIEILNDEG